MKKDINIASDCTVLIPSCDKYSDLWFPFFTLFFRYWPDCPFPVCLGSNELKYDDDRVRTIMIGPDGGWSISTIKMIEAIETNYVLIILDDFFLRRKVVTEDVVECLDALDALDGHTIRLLPKFKPDYLIDNFPYLGRIDNENRAPYSVSLQAGIWRTSSLRSLLRETESIWEFELLGSERAAVMSPGFYTARRHVLDYGRHVVQRGKWFMTDAHRYGRMNIGCDFSKRSVYGLRTELAWWLTRVEKVCSELVNWKTRRKIRGMLGRIKRSISVGGK